MIGHVFADLAVQIGHGDWVQFYQRRIGFYDIIEFRRVNKIIAQHPRRLRIDLGDNCLGNFAGGLGRFDPDAKRAVTMFVWRRNLNQRDVNRKNPPVEHLGDFREKDGMIVRPPFVHRLPDVFAGEQGAMPEMALVFGVGVICRSDGQQVDDFHIFQF